MSFQRRIKSFHEAGELSRSRNQFILDSAHFFPLDEDFLDSASLLAAFTVGQGEEPVSQGAVGTPGAPRNEQESLSDGKGSSSSSAMVAIAECGAAATRAREPDAARLLLSGVAPLPTGGTCFEVGFEQAVGVASAKAWRARAERRHRNGRRPGGKARVLSTTLAEEWPPGGGERQTLECWVGLQKVAPRSSDSCQRASDDLVERGSAKSWRNEVTGSGRTVGEIRPGGRRPANGGVTQAAGASHLSERGMLAVSHRNGRGPGGKERSLGSTLSEERPPNGGGGRAMECWLGLQSGAPRSLDSRHTTSDGPVER